MELRFLNPAVPGTVFLEVLGQFIGGRLAERAECPEILDFEQPGDTFRYFPFVVTDCMEVRASG